MPATRNLWSWALKAVYEGDWGKIIWYQAYAQDSIMCVGRQLGKNNSLRHNNIPNITILQPAIKLMLKMLVFHSLASTSYNSKEIGNFFGKTCIYVKGITFKRHIVLGVINSLENISLKTTKLLCCSLCGGDIECARMFATP